MKKKIQKTPLSPVNRRPLEDIFHDDFLELCQSSKNIENSCSSVKPSIRHIRNILNVLYIKIEYLEHELKKERERHISPNPKYF